MRCITCPAAATSAMIHSFPDCQHALLAQRWQAPSAPLHSTCRQSLPSGRPRSCRNLTASAARNAKRGKGAGGGSGGDGQLIQVEEDGSDAWRLEPALQSIRSGGVRSHTRITSPPLPAPSSCRCGWLWPRVGRVGCPRVGCNTLYPSRGPPTTLSPGATAVPQLPQRLEEQMLGGIS